MNRELKFRVWDKERKEFIEWLNADPMIQCSSGMLLCWERTQNKDGSFGEDIIVNKPEFSNNLVVQQFTGLKDKNNKDIYEGDIVKYEFQGGDDQSSIMTEEVVFLNGKFDPIPDEFNCDDPWYSWKFYNFEVIGNIFENPELLT